MNVGVWCVGVGGVVCGCGCGVWSGGVVCRCVDVVGVVCGCGCGGMDVVCRRVKGESACTTLTNPRMRLTIGITYLPWHLGSEQKVNPSNYWLLVVIMTSTKSA